ncbi:MAG: hypothetical protein NTY77_02635 [Elusimicrobia bacterium]|nr:hypothetical protein [Elusimicrobiota bacterium]
MRSGKKTLFLLLLALLWAPSRARAQQARLPAAARSVAIGLPPALGFSAVSPGAAPLGSLAGYEVLLQRQRAGEALDLSKVTRPGIAFVSGDRLSVAQGSGRFEALRAGERMDLFVPQDQKLPEGVAVVARDIPAQLVLKANLLSSRGEAGSNPELVGFLTEGRTFMRVLAPRELVEAPLSRAAHEVEDLRAFLKAGERAWGAGAKSGLDAYLESPAFRDLSVNEQRQALLRLSALVRQNGASEAFTSGVRAQLAEAVPEPMLTDIESHGYAVLVKDHLTQDRPDLKSFYDYTGGLTDWGPLGNFVMVAEHMKKDGKDGAAWIDNLNWRNSAVHECGHAIDNINGFTDTPEFRDAWQADFQAMPEAVKKPVRQDGGRNEFFYFLNQRTPGYAYRETFAEAFDVLLRGEASSFNHDDFHRYFPRTLAAVRRILEARYGRSLH